LEKKSSDEDEEGTKPKPRPTQCDQIETLVACGNMLALKNGTKLLFANLDNTFTTFLYNLETLTIENIFEESVDMQVDGIRSLVQLDENTFAHVFNEKFLSIWNIISGTRVFHCTLDTDLSDFVLNLVTACDRQIWTRKLDCIDAYNFNGEYPQSSQLATLQQLHKLQFKQQQLHKFHMGRDSHRLFYHMSTVAPHTVAISDSKGEVEFYDTRSFTPILPRIKFHRNVVLCMVTVFKEHRMVHEYGQEQFQVKLLQNAANRCYTNCNIMIDEKL